MDKNHMLFQRSIQGLDSCMDKLLKLRNCERGWRFLRLNLWDRAENRLRGVRVALLDSLHGLAFLFLWGIADFRDNRLWGFYRAGKDGLFDAGRNLFGSVQATAKLNSLLNFILRNVMRLRYCSSCVSFCNLMVFI